MKPLHSLPLALSLVLSPLMSALAAPPTEHPPAVPLAYSLEAFRSEIRAGGPGKDGIPSIDRPHFQPADQANLDPDERIIGVHHNGVVRAYPQRILVWHEIVNDELGGEPVSITYCPLTGTALGFKRGTTELGVSGRLVNSNLIMYDRASDSEWPQILGAAIDGPLEGHGLEEFRVVWTTWERWQARHPDSEVLTDRTGFVRNYQRDPYGSYTSVSGYYRPDSARLFPVMNRDDRFAPKTEILGFRTRHGAAAIVPEALAAEGVASQASAMSFDLNNGYSSSQAVGGKDHYTLQVQSPTRVTIASQAFIPTETAHIHVRAALRDENSSVVTTAARQGSNFVLDRQLQPGTYTLEVESRNASGKQQGANRYQLIADF